RLPYTDMVLLETMRMYPPAWIIGRRVLKDYAVGGYVLPAGSFILMSPYVMHYDPRYYAEPHRFDPERWTMGARESRPQFSYFPFGGGPHRCIGEGLALLEGVLLLATLASRWRPRLAARRPPKPVALVGVMIPSAMPMRLERRDDYPAKGLSHVS
ncbi:MAG TPA: cytochrome P450, partial [Pyrinomonadaceae bacterium]